MDIEQDIINKVKGLTEQELALYTQNFELRKKSTVWAFTLALFLGVVGAHRYYTGRPGTGVVYSVMWLIGLVLIESEVVVGNIIFICIFISVIIDLFEMNSFLLEYHKKVMQDILMELKMKSKADKFLYKEREWLQGA